MHAELGGNCLSTMTPVVICTEPLFNYTQLLKSAINVNWSDFLTEFDMLDEYCWWLEGHMLILKTLSYSKAQESSHASLKAFMKMPTRSVVFVLHVCTFVMIEDSSSLAYRCLCFINSHKQNKNLVPATMVLESKKAKMVLVETAEEETCS